jgi:hypothetical protein
MYPALVEAGLLASCPEDVYAITGLVDAVAAPFHNAVLQRTQVARASFAALRKQLIEHLAAMGPAVAYLERLDRLVNQHTDVAIRDLHGRLALSLQHRFAGQLLAAVRDLHDTAGGAPEGIQLTALAPWYGPEGWLRRHIRTCRSVVTAVCDHEWRALDGLLLAASTLAAQSALDA